MGNFPLNDDWSMGMTVKRLIELGDYRPVGWMAMTLIAQVFWGRLFCIPEGFSFTALRFSTLTLSFVGTVAFYFLIRQLRGPRLVALVCALTFSLNPVYFALSCTFMTDVPFTALIVLSSLFFIRHLQRNSSFDLWWATILGIVATLCRQVGPAVSIAFGVAFWFQSGFQKRSLLRAFLPAIITVVVLIAFNLWLKTSGRMPASYNVRSDELVEKLKHPLTLPLNFAHYGWNMVMYLGIFLLPILVLARLRKSSDGRKSEATRFVVAVLIAFGLLSVARLLFRPGLMPVHNNILDPSGIGPLTLRDTQLLKLPHVPGLPVVFWLIITILSFIGAGLLISNVVGTTVRIFSKYRSVKQPGKNESDPSSNTNETENSNAVAIVFFLTCTLVYLAPFLVNGFFDRYLLPVVIFLAGLIVVSSDFGKAPSHKWRYLVTIMLVVGLGTYAVAGTRDYLEWNRVRWSALKDLQQLKVWAEEIDGGFEFNGWNFYDPNYHSPAGKSDWWVVDDKYLLSFGEMTGYDVFREYRYFRWMPPHQGRIFVLKRKEALATRNGGR